MHTAKDAKRISDESPCDYLTEIDKIIEMNAKLGLYECCYELTAHKTVADNIAATLEELGYYVEVTLHPSLTKSFSHLIYIRWNDPLTTVTKTKNTKHQHNLPAPPSPPRQANPLD